MPQIRLSLVSSWQTVRYVRPYTLTGAFHDQFGTCTHGRSYVCTCLVGRQERCVAALTEDDLKSLAAAGELRFGTLCAGRVLARVAAFLGVHGRYRDGTYERASACTYALARTCAPSPPVAVRTARTYVRRQSHGVTNRLSPEPRPVMMTRPVGLQAYAAYICTYVPMRDRCRQLFDQFR